MNDFLYQELLTEEYRRNLMAAAEEHNRFARISEKKFTLNAYLALSGMGALLERWGARMSAHYNCLAKREQRDMLPTLAK